eukprot:jgi/Botrbrau1/7505/Bobra.0095s0041.1
MESLLEVYLTIEPQTPESGSPPRAIKATGEPVLQKVIGSLQVATQKLVSVFPQHPAHQLRIYIQVISKWTVEGVS